MLGDRMPKGLALLGILDRLLESGAGQAYRKRTDSDSSAVQDSQGLGQALARVTEQVFRRYANLIIGDRVCRGTFEPHFFLGRTYTQAFGIRGDDDQA